MKRWVFRSTRQDFCPNRSETGACGQASKSELEEQKLASDLKIAPLVVRLMRQRGLADKEAMNRFLDPRLGHLPDSALWAGMKEAVDRLETAVREGWKIAVWGDYDVDGITAATLVLEVLHFHGVEVQVHLPDRLKEGYGLNVEGVERLARDGVKLLLTVDCGISDVDAVSRAKELGLVVVISDHHLPPERLPPADAIVNPKLLVDGKENPCPDLAGVGVAFYLMQTLNSRLAALPGRDKKDIREELDLVALGTLADLVPLTGQNRILVRNGLLKIAEARRPGLAELKVVSKFSPQAAVSSGQVSFSLAPRINAAGRLGNPELAHRLLLAESSENSALLAQQLDALNTERREEEQRIADLALEQAAGFEKSMGLVLYGKDWHQGVIGIVASRVVEALHRPVFILCGDGKKLKGSGRSVSGFNLHEGLEGCSDLLLDYGGHKMAAGLSLKPEQLDAFRERFDAVVRGKLGDEPLLPEVLLDGELSFTEASELSVIKSLQMLQPFGEGNPEPVFASLPLVVRQRRVFGHRGEHVSLGVTEEDSGITLQAKIWRQAEHFPSEVLGRRLRLAYTPGINAHNGISSVELTVKDWDFLES